MECSKCGAKVKENEKFCNKCGEKIKSDVPITEEERKLAQQRLKEYSESGGDTPEQFERKRKNKFSITSVDNPMMLMFTVSFMACLAFLGAAIISFSLSNGSFDVILTGIVFLIISVFFGWLAFFIFIKPARTLKNMLRGKKLAAKWELSADELNGLVNTDEKKHRGKFISAVVFGSVGIILGIMFMHTAEAFWQTIIWISLAALGFGIALLVLYPKYRRKRMIEKGSKILIGEDAVFANGTFYYWRNVDKKRTYAVYNEKKNTLKIEFCKAGKDKLEKKRVEVCVPRTKLKEAFDLVKAYEKTALKYEEELKKQRPSQLIN